MRHKHDIVCFSIYYSAAMHVILSSGKHELDTYTVWTWVVLKISMSDGKQSINESGRRDKSIAAAQEDRCGEQATAG